MELRREGRVCPPGFSHRCIRPAGTQPGLGVIAVYSFKAPDSLQVVETSPATLCSSHTVPTTGRECQQIRYIFEMPKTLLPKKTSSWECGHFMKRMYPEDSSHLALSVISRHLEKWLFFACHFVHRLFSSCCLVVCVLLQLMELLEDDFFFLATPVACRSSQARD